MNLIIGIFLFDVGLLAKGYGTVVGAGGSIPALLILFNVDPFSQQAKVW